MKHRYASARPYGKWLEDEVVTLDRIVESVDPAALELPAVKGMDGDDGEVPSDGVSGIHRLLKPLTAFGYTVSREPLSPLVPLAPRWQAKEWGQNSACVFSGVGVPTPWHPVLA